MIRDSFINELRYRLNIEDIVSAYVPLKKTGRNLKGLCPFHSEKTPSFMVYPETNSFYCFGCGAGGDPITFIKLIEHLEYKEALRFAAQKVGMNMPEDIKDDKTAKLRMKILEINRMTAKFFYSVLKSPKGSDGMYYLEARKLSDSTIKTFGLGYAPDSFNTLTDYLFENGFSKDELIAAQVAREGKNGGCYDLFRGRVIFPIIDLKGSVIGFGGRILNNDKPKYLNSPDTLVFKKSRNLYGLNRAKATKAESLILTEGYMDTIALHQAGFDNAIATLGTSLTPEQARLIANYSNEVIISYDSDEAGKKATARATEIFSELGIYVKVLNMAGAKDPDEYIKKNGRESFKALITSSLSSTENKIEILKKKYNITTDDGKVKFLKDFCLLMAQTKDRMASEVYTTKIANDLNVSKEAIIEQVKSLRKKEIYRERKKFENSISAFPEKSMFSKDPQRLQNYKYAQCEDKLLAFLFRNPDSFSTIKALIAPERFVTDSNREIMEGIETIIEEGQQPDITTLSTLLPTEQISRFSGILANNAGKNLTLQMAKELATIILSRQNEKSNVEIVTMEIRELDKYIADLSANKK